jgi:hypothetical protein
VVSPLAIENTPTHVWSRESARAIIRSSCLIFNMSPGTNSKVDMFAFLVVAWVVHLDLIPTKVGCIVPEPVELSVAVVPLLFPHEEDIIHAKQDTLQFRAIVKVIQVQDYMPPSNSDNSDVSTSSDGADDLPRAPVSSLAPWPRDFCLAGDDSPVGEPWPCLLKLGGIMDLAARPRSHRWLTAARSERPHYLSIIAGVAAQWEPWSQLIARLQGLQRSRPEARDSLIPSTFVQREILTVLCGFRACTACMPQRRSPFQPGQHGRPCVGMLKPLSCHFV